MIQAFLRFLFQFDSSLCWIDKEGAERRGMCNLSELRLPCRCSAVTSPLALCPRLTSSLPQVSRCFCSSNPVYSCFPAVSATPNPTLSTWEKNQWSTFQKQTGGQVPEPWVKLCSLIQVGWRSPQEALLNAKWAHPWRTAVTEEWFDFAEFFKCKEHWKAFPGLAIGRC